MTFHSCWFYDTNPFLGVNVGNSEQCYRRELNIWNHTLCRMHITRVGKLSTGSFSYLACAKTNALIFTNYPRVCSWLPARHPYNILTVCHLQLNDYSKQLGETLRSVKRIYLPRPVWQASTVVNDRGSSFGPHMQQNKKEKVKDQAQWRPIICCCPFARHHPLHVTDRNTSQKV